MEMILILVNSFLVGLSGALMPGPLLSVVISASAKRGFWAGPIVVIGHAIAEVGIVIALFFGLSEFLKVKIVFQIISYVGGAVLILLGVQIFQEIIKKRIKLEISFSDKTSQIKSVFHGILASLSNPYWILWWGTIGLAFITKSLKFGIAGLTAFYFGHIFSDLIWYSAVSLGISKGKKVISEKVYKGLIFICGIFLLLIGGYFILSA